MMKRKLAMAMLGIAVLLLFTACAASHSSSGAAESEKAAAQPKQQISTKSSVNAENETENYAEEHEEPEKGDNMITLTVGEQSFDAVLEDNSAARELAELLSNGAITMPASNYGGFEKVCSLGTSLTADDVQTTTQAGDIMLYSGNQIVIFYGSNSWAYTKLATVVDEDLPNLSAVLSGRETQVTIELQR